jgi:hypothetical protein
MKLPETLGAPPRGFPQLLQYVPTSENPQVGHLAADPLGAGTDIEGGDFRKQASDWEQISEQILSLESKFVRHSGESGPALDRDNPPRTMIVLQDGQATRSDDASIGNNLSHSGFRQLSTALFIPSPLAQARRERHARGDNSAAQAQP